MKISTIATLLTGAAIGSSATWFYLNNRKEVDEKATKVSQTVSEAASSIKETFSNKEPEGSRETIFERTFEVTMAPKENEGSAVLFLPFKISIKDNVYRTELSDGCLNDEDNITAESSKKIKVAVENFIDNLMVDIYSLEGELTDTELHSSITKAKAKSDEQDHTAEFKISLV